MLERTPDLGPVGAGILLQHLGQQVAHRLGIGEALRALSAPVRRVDGATTSGMTTMSFAYADGVPGAMGWGVHRGDLFTLLHEAAVDAGAVVVPRCEVVGLRRSGTGWSVEAADGVVHGPFDLVVGADGAGSRVRALAFEPRTDRRYGWGAVWAIVPDPEHLAGDALVQRWRDTRTTLGLLPTGRDRVSIFWSVRAREADAVVAAGPAAFVDRVAPLAGRFAPLVERVADVGLLPARYRDVVVGSPVGDRVVLVGDAAHAMSPQLGIGASMGLADAWSLAWALREHRDVGAALAAHADLRRRHVTAYRWLSMLLTPVFQSGLVPIGPPRDAALAVACRTGFVRRQAVSLLMGTRLLPRGTWSLPG